ncbi:MAG: hypothetical protein GY778_22300 [bacterium]|nr:hypothetical protein [bacterium]
MREGIVRGLTLLRPARWGTMALGLLVAGCLGQTRPPVAAETREGRWRQDLQYLNTNLRRLHADLFFKIEPDAFDATIQVLDRSIDALADHEIIVGLMRLVTRVGDAHTRLHWQGHTPWRSYPLRLYWFSDGLYVVAAHREYAEAVGKRLVGLGGAEVAEVCAALAEVIPHENQAALRQYLPDHLVVPQILRALGYADDDDRTEYVFADADGRELTVEVTPPGRRGFRSWRRWVSARNQAGGSRPLYLTRYSDYWFHYLEDSKTLFCQYNRCADNPERPFAEFAKRVLTFVDEHPVERFVLDLRRNAGGDSRVAAPLIRGLAGRKNINRPGGVLVLVGRRTFSSALLNALTLQRRTEAVFIGEPTGQKPNAFGEVKRFKLPNCKIPVSYSTRYFKMVSGDPPSFVPDVLVEVSSADYFAGRDRVLEAALNYSVD